MTGIFLVVDFLVKRQKRSYTTDNIVSSLCLSQVLKSGLCTGHTSPGINKAVLHSMDFLSHFPYIGSLDFVLYFVSRPFWLCPVRSTLLQYVLDSSSTCCLTQIVLGTDSASICSYSSLYLASHALIHSLTHASSGLVYKEDILCCSSSVFRSQTEE